jgi:hypothetical protein
VACGSLPDAAKGRRSARIHVIATYLKTFRALSYEWLHMLVDAGDHGSSADACQMLAQARL